MWTDATKTLDETLAPDCRHYRGDRPCIANRLCAGCDRYEPYTHRICVIKLGALGDVIRTLCILPQLKSLYPQGQVTWVTLPGAARMIQGHSQIDRVIEFDALQIMPLLHEKFDTVICLDKEAQPCSLAMSLQADQKLGMGLSPSGTPIPLNPQALDYFHLGLSDDLKFNHNTQSYAQLVYSALGWTYSGERYELPLDPSCRQAQATRLEALGWSPRRPTLGMNVGAGKVFANKMWPADKQIQLIDLLRVQQPDVQILLLGGPDERPIVNEILTGLTSERHARGVWDAGTDHDEPTFVAMVSLCDTLFSGDTMAMHVAIALGKGVVAFFGPTCEQEIDLFGQGEKLVAKVPCAPCYKRICDKNDICQHAMEVDQAAEAIGRVLNVSMNQVMRESIRPWSLKVLSYQQAG